MTSLKMTFALTALTLTIAPPAHAYGVIDDVDFPRPTVVFLPQLAVADVPQAGEACGIDILAMLATSTQRPLTEGEIAQLACVSE